MPISLEEFLRAHHFIHDPFATTNAEQEQTHLSSYFVRVSWFDLLVGNPALPESLILFAPRGHGKTIHRLEVARRASSFRDAPALVVSFTDFDLLLKDDIESIEIETYLRIIRQKTLEALDQHLSQQRNQERFFNDNEATFAQFCALLHLFAPLKALRRRTRSSLTDQYIEAYQQTTLSLKDWLKELSEIVQQAGFTSTYFLIDGIDEWMRTSNNLTDVAPRILQPLLDAPGVLQECGFAFKFFLPDTLEPALHSHQVGRLERLPVYKLSWTEEDLLIMLSRRLTASSLINDTSGIGYVNQVSDICEVFEADKYLVQSTFPSPRRLIDRARQLLIYHCKHTTDPDAFISEETFRAIVPNVPSSQSMNKAAPTSARPASVIASEAIKSSPIYPPVTTEQPVAPLRFDDAGQIWLGNEIIIDDPRKLTRLMRICMEFLWTHRGRTVRYEELQQALYPQDFELRQDPKASCDKIVRRLRELIHHNKNNAQTYIAVQPGIGYILRNFADEPSSEKNS